MGLVFKSTWEGFFSFSYILTAMSIRRRKINRHSMDLSDNFSITSALRPATPLFHRTLRRSVQDSRTFQATIPLGMGRIHHIPNHLAELKAMSSSLSTPLRLRRGSQHIQDTAFRPPSNLRRRLVAKSPFPGKTEYKNISPPETPARKTPTPGSKNFKIPRGAIEEYEGEYFNGNFHGEGKALYTNGDTYQGQWYEGKKQGIGTYFYSYFGASYQGDWFNDEKNGFGVIRFVNGDEIQGFWEHGTVNGDNTLMEFANGCVYTGGVRKGLRCGKGKMRYFEGVEYNGEWKDDCREGFGVMIHESFFFEGHFHNDSAEGPGILVYKTKDESLKEPVVLNKPKSFHPIFSVLGQLGQFSEFLKNSYSVGDCFIFSNQGGSFSAGKLNG